MIYKVSPNFVLGTYRFIGDYNPKYGLELSRQSHIKTTKTFNQDTSFTFFMSFKHSTTQRGLIAFAHLCNDYEYFPRFLILNNKIIMRNLRDNEYESPIIGKFQNEQLFIWICYDHTQNLYKMALSNYSAHVSQTFNPPDNFQTRYFKIDYFTYVNKIGFTDRFIDVNSIEHHRIMLEEKRNGSYLE